MAGKIVLFAANNFSRRSPAAGQRGQFRQHRLLLPVIMAPNHYGWWLKGDDGRSESHKMALGHPLEEPLKIYPVSDLVNNPKTDDARCIEPVAIDRDFSSGNCGEKVEG
jgi:hypothetical protein